MRYTKPTNFVKSKLSEESSLNVVSSDFDRDDEDPLSIKSLSTTFLGIFLATMTILLPSILAEDGAPLDAMVIMDEPTFAGCLIKARPIGVLDMHDCGAYDGKLLCVPIANPRQSNIISINQIASNQLENVAEFFRTSKGLDGRTVQINGWRDYDVVEDLLKKCTPSKKKTFKALKKSSIMV